MAIRDRLADWLLRRFTGELWFVHGECQTMPHPEYERAAAAADELLERLVHAVDWRRLAIEATGRHMAHDPDGWDRGELCGDCIRDALLARDPHTGPITGAPPPVPDRHADHVDYAALLAAHVDAARIIRSHRKP